MKFWFLTLLSFGFLLMPLGLVQAVTVDELRQIAGNDFVVLPGRQEAQLAPGTETEKTITIINRLGRTATFVLGVEDIKSTTDEAEPVALLADELGPYSLKNYLFPGRSEVTLEAGGVAQIPITIALPPQAPPGGLYGAVTVTTARPPQAESNTQIATRAAVLFLVKVEGPVLERAETRNFGLTGSRLRIKPRPLTFHVAVANSGNVYLNPYGYIKLQNVISREATIIPIDPWFVLPGSTRLREFMFDPGHAIGVYRADLALNRGYGDQVDYRSIWLVLLPWPFVLGLLLVIIAIGLVRRRMLQSKR